MTPHTDSPKTMISLYSGLGGLDYGFAQHGYRTLATAEADKHAAATHHNWLTHFQNEAPQHYSNVLELLADVENGTLDFPQVDVITGGPPCQGFSRAGAQDSNDPRSAHVFVFMDVVAAMQPRAFVMENVSTLATGARFSEVYETFIARAEAAGYTVATHIVDAADYGTPQHRKRAIIIGTLDGEAIGLPVSDGQHMTVVEVFATLPRFGTPGNDTHYGCRVIPSKRPVIGRARNPYQGIFVNGPGRPLDMDRPSRTLTANMDGGRGPFVDQAFLDGHQDTSWHDDYFDHLKAGGEPATADDVPVTVRRISVEEAAALTGVPSIIALHGPVASQYRQIGNCVPPPLSQTISKAVDGVLSGVAV